MNKLAIILGTAATGLSALAATVTSDTVINISNVSFTQDDATRKVTIHYDIDQDAQVWFDVLSGGKSIGREKVKTVTGDVTHSTGDTLVTAGTGKTIVWHARKDWPEQQKNDIQIVVEAAYANEVAPWYRYIVFDLSGGASATEYPLVEGRQEPPATGWGDCQSAYKISKLVMRRIDPGTFVRGNDGVEVTMPKPFYIGVFDLTYAQAQRIKSGALGCEVSWRPTKAYPAGKVTMDIMRGAGMNWPTVWDVAADSVIGRLRARAKVAGFQFDIPTYAQYEYAGRAGTTTKFNNDSDDPSAMNLLGCYAGNAAQSFGDSEGNGGWLKPVGCFRPNNWGLYDMHGNVFKLMLARDTSVGNTANGPVGAISGGSLGGLWYSGSRDASAESCKSGATSSISNYTDVRFGVRLAMQPLD